LLGTGSADDKKRLVVPARFAPRSRHGRWSWSRMYGLALPRCRYEIVFKNAGQTARE